MTRWLEAARRASEAGTKPTQLTKPPDPEVLSEKSVLSGGRKPLTAGANAAPDLRARLEEARARVAALADADGVARTDEAIGAVWDEAEALAALREAEKEIVL